MKRTKIISCAGEKGGLGKTTINILLATNLVKSYGRSVLLIDMDDPQYSVFGKRQRELLSVDREEKVKIPYEIEKGTVDTVKDIVKNYLGKVDIIIIDFPGQLNGETVYGLYFVEHVFIPFTYDDLEIASTVVFYRTLMKRYLPNEKAALESVHVFFNKYKRIKKNKFKELRDELESAGIGMMESVVLDKTAYTEKYRSTLNGIAKGKESGEYEIQHFFKEVLKIVNN